MKTTMIMQSFYGRSRLVRDAQAAGLVVLNEGDGRTVIDAGTYSVTMTEDAITGSDQRKLSAEEAKAALGL